MAGMDSYEELFQYFCEHECRFNARNKELHPCSGCYTVDFASFLDNLNDDLNQARNKANEPERPIRFIWWG